MQAYGTFISINFDLFGSSTFGNDIVGLDLFFELDQIPQIAI